MLQPDTMYEIEQMIELVDGVLEDGELLIIGDERSKAESKRKIAKTVKTLKTLVEAVDDELECYDIEDDQWLVGLLGDCQTSTNSILKLVRRIDKSLKLDVGSVPRLLDVLQSELDTLESQVSHL